MKRFKAFILRLTDANWAWWPFVHLRPAKTQRMTPGFVAKLTVTFGSIGAALTAALIWKDGERNVVVIVLFALLAILVCFVVYWLTVARWWNERAKSAD